MLSLHGFKETKLNETNDFGRRPGRFAYWFADGKGKAIATVLILFSTFLLFQLKIRMPALPHDKGVLVGEIDKSDFPVLGKMPVFIVNLHQYGLAG